jgi:DNA-binding SARP family transcriptional activator/tetratricopeptide (TPR) repeat protein
MIDLRVLGTLEIYGADGAPVGALTQPKRIALLLYLTLAEPAGSHSRDSLVALLWPEADDESARHSLRNALYGLRQTLGEAAFVTRGEGYVGLEVGAIRCDALEVRRLLAEAKWADAVAEWEGELVPGFHVSGAPEFESWLEEQRVGLRRAVTGAAWRRVDDLERSGDPGLVAAAQRAWALEPANEAGARRLMRFLDASVGPAAALGAYEDLSGYLRRECEAAPSAETQLLAGALKAKTGPALASSSAQAPSPSSQPPASPAAPTPAALSVESPATTPLSLPPQRRRPAAMAWVAGALLAVGMTSLFALRPGRTTSAHATEDSVRGAARDAALRLPARYRQDTAAYASYLRGLALRFDGTQVESRDTFEALVRRNPLYAPGIAGLAHAYALTTVYGDMQPGEGWPKVEAAAQRALALDSASASAYIALGSMEMHWRWDLPRAGQLIDKGLALEPGDPEAHAVRGTWFRWRGEIDSAVAEARKSAELDPLGRQWTLRLARQLRLARRYPEAEAIYRRMIRDDPQEWRPYMGLSDLYRTMGHLRDAIAIWREADEVSADTVEAARLPVAPTEAEAARWFADEARGRLDALRRSVRDGEWVGAGAFEKVYAELRDTSATLQWFDSMLVHRDPSLQTIPIDPDFDWLRGDPRYKAWEAKLPWRRRAAEPVSSPAEAQVQPQP